ncbi:MAG: MFS transporter [bacterium]|nr:MFS transporter [bacterium]
MFTMGGIWFLMPLYLTDVHALRATSIGTISTIHAAALLVTMRIGGQLADHWSCRWPVLIGASVQVGSALYFAWLPETVPLSLIAAGLIVHGLGAGIMLATLHRTSMARIPPDQTGIAAGLYSMIRFGGWTLGVALGGVVLQYGSNQALPLIEAYQLVFRFISGIAFSGILIAWKLDR